MKTAPRTAARPAPARSARQPRGQKTRQAILRRAVDLASVDGLEGLTIGRLASALRISKSGLFAHFGSKEELQLAVIEEAKNIFGDQVIRPAFEAKGLRRLRSLCENWIAYAEGHVFPGGCFFSAASLEFDDRPGKVRDRIVELMKQWLSILEEGVRQAQARDEIRKSVDARQAAFEIHALAMGSNWSSRLFKDENVFKTVRRAIFRRIEEITEPATVR